MKNRLQIVDARFSASRTSFLSPKQQCQSSEGIVWLRKLRTDAFTVMQLLIQNTRTS